jgi:hypothetical protein
MSVEIGDVYGMLLPVPSVVSAYENMQSLKDLPRAERLFKLVQVPFDLLKQMNLDFSSRNQTSSANTSMMVSTQFFLKEGSEENEAEENFEQNPKRHCV